MRLITTLHSHINRLLTYNLDIRSGSELSTQQHRRYTLGLHKLGSILIVLLAGLVVGAQSNQQGSAKPTGKLSGVVVDATDAVVLNAHVVIEREGFQLAIAATQEGTFDSELPVGIYKVIAVKDSRFMSQESLVEVRANASTKIKLTLKDSATLLDSIRDSHINANVPSEADFDLFMKRDLTEYFKDTTKSVVVEYELLRKGPTQSGVAFPKFYVWVVVKSEGKTIEEGAARVAAVEKKSFEVVNYLLKSEIEKDVQRLNRLFPAEVADKIKEKLKQ